MPDININLHPGQMRVYNNKARFKVCVAGRRFGKSYLSCVCLGTEVLKDVNEFGYDLSTKDVYYIAPTQQMARDIMWRLLKLMWKDVITATHENTMVATFANGRRVHLKGADNPDSLRGVGLSYAVLDEYANMKPETWEVIIRPTLGDVKGGALFIGTRAGKNWFHKLYEFAASGTDPNWAGFNFKSADNPYLDSEEIETMRRTMSAATAREELDGGVSGSEGLLFKFDNLPIGPEPSNGSWYIACDLAGFGEVQESRKLSFAQERLDEHAYAVVKVNQSGWYCDDIICGRWGVEKAADKLIDAVAKYRPVAVGIEKGVSRNALMPYVHDKARRRGIYPNWQPLTHGRKSKTDRITWALQGRLENKLITFRKGEYLEKLTDQLLDFPNPLAHDDLPDALSYIDQLKSVSYFAQSEYSNWEPLDEIAGY